MLNCQVAKLPSCKLLNCELAIMERNPFRSCLESRRNTLNNNKSPNLTSGIFPTLIFNGHMMQQACSLFSGAFFSWLSFFRVVRAFLIEQCVFFNDFADWLLDGPSDILGCEIFEVASFMTIWIVGILQPKFSSTLF